MQCTSYRQAIRSLMYLAITTHPNIAFTVLILSCFLNNPRDVHWEAVKHVYCYLKFTKDMSLTYGGNQHDLEEYTDADSSTQEDIQYEPSLTMLFSSMAVQYHGVPRDKN